MNNLHLKNTNRSENTFIHRINLNQLEQDYIKNYIENTPAICFDLSTSIDLHLHSTAHTEEQAIDGVKSGLIKLDEFVTWRAKHFGIWFTLTTSIIEYERPDYFVDAMTAGLFKRMRHEHIFEDINGATIMTDKFYFRSPFGILGRIIDKLILQNYLKRLLIKRNEVIKEYAETEKWRRIIPV